MKARRITEGVDLIGAVDWDRRLFDSLVPLPEGTSYNSYLIRGSEKVALLDAVEPSMAHVLMRQLADVPHIDYIVSHHAEQDHSGTLPLVLEKYPQAQILCSTKCKPMLIDHLAIAGDRITTVEDGETVSLGDKTLQFVYTPWVHWPETMSTYLPEDKILFSCDFFGSHLATSEVYAEERIVYEPAKRYYAEIMMPFRTIIQKNLAKLADYDIRLIAPSHGPLFDRPALIMDAYRDWAANEPKNIVVLPYTSMHGSTKIMVEHLITALVERGVQVEQINLDHLDAGKLAIALVDAATMVVGTPTLLAGPHPNAAYAATLANVLRPKMKFVSVVGSYGWGGKAGEQLLGLMSSLKVEVLPPVFCRGLPGADELAALDTLAETIANKHKESGLIPA